MHSLCIMVELVLGLQLHYDLVHYIFFYLFHGLGDGATWPVVAEKRPVCPRVHVIDFNNKNNLQTIRRL